MDLSDLQPATITLIDPVGTNPPTHMNISSAGELSCTVKKPSVTGDASQQDNFSEVRATVAQPGLASCEQMQTFVHPEFASEEIAQDVFASEVDQLFSLGFLESVCELNEPHGKVTRESNSTEIHSGSALSYSGQRNEIPATNNGVQSCFSQNSDLFPAASSSRIKEPKQQGVKHCVTGDAIGNTTGVLRNTRTSDSPARIPVVSARGRKSYRSRSSAFETPAKKSLKRSIVYLNEDPEPCCSTSGMSQAACNSISPNSSCGSAEKKMCLNWSLNAPRPKLLKESETFVDTPSLTRSDFNSEELFRLYLEQQDHQLALRLQRKFDLESKPKKIPRSSESGGYNLRCKGKLSTNSQEEIN